MIEFAKPNVVNDKRDTCDSCGKKTDIVISCVNETKSSCICLCDDCLVELNKKLNNVVRKIRCCRTCAHNNGTSFCNVDEPSYSEYHVCGFWKSKEEKDE